MKKDANGHEIMTMTVEEWAKVPDNPRQRNTVERARKAKHLLELKPSHLIVYAAKLPDGKLIKLDGHTRSYMWTHGMVEGPKLITVILIRCTSAADAAEKYALFDSPFAVEGTSDMLYGLCHQLGVVFTSTMMKTHRFAAGLALAQQFWHGSNTYNRERMVDILQDWKAELLALDSIEPTHLRFFAPVMGGALLILRAYGEEARTFLEAYQQNAGFKQRKMMDGVQALFEYVAAKRADREIQGGAVRAEVIRTVVAMFLVYRDDIKIRADDGAKAHTMTDKQFRNWLEAVKSE